MTELPLVTTIERLVKGTVLLITEAARAKRALTELPPVTTVERLVRGTVLLITEAARAKRALTERPLVTTVERLVIGIVLLITEARIKQAPGQENNHPELVIQALQHNGSSRVTPKAFITTHLGLPDSRAKPVVWLNQCLRPHRHAYPAHRHFLKFKLGLNLPV